MKRSAPGTDDSYSEPKNGDADRARRGGRRLRPEEAEWKRACSLADSGRVREAIQLLAAAADADPSSASRRNDLGVMMARAGIPTQAAVEFAAAAKLAPKEPTAHYNLGNALDDAGEHGKAVAAYRRAIRLSP